MGEVTGNCSKAGSRGGPRFTGNSPEGRCGCRERSLTARLGVYLFLGLLAFTVDLTRPFSASTAAICVSALSVRLAKAIDHLRLTTERSFQHITTVTMVALLTFR